MLYNSSLTVYHKTKIEHDYTWVRYNYDKVWWFSNEGSKTNKGYANENNVEIRISYKLNPGLNPDNFNIGDIVVKGSLDADIKSENDVPEQYFTILALANNTFGENAHIHLSGK